MTKTALITGITGQDGSYLADFLLDKGYKVHGIVRKIHNNKKNEQQWRIQSIKKKIHLHFISIENYSSVLTVIELIRPNEIYHLAAQISSNKTVNYSFENDLTMDININSTYNILSAIKESKIDSKFYFAGSSEMFGNAEKSPQNENSTFHPRSPYGISKVVGYELTKNYREFYDIHASTGILFNHESERRGFEFVTRKISVAAAKIKLKIDKKIQLGNLESKRDWGYAPEYVHAMWLMMQEDNPDDYVVGTGKAHSVEEFVKKSFEILDLNYLKYIEIKNTFYRPSENQTLISDSKKIYQKIGWESQTSFDNLIKKMVLNDYNNLKNLI